MGKALPSTTRLQELTRFFSAGKFAHPKRNKQVSQVKVSPPQTVKRETFRVEPNRHRLKMETTPEVQSRVPLAEVVSDCARRWFRETLKEAQDGNTAKQVLVGQMYHSGYGVSKNPKEAHAWISRASRHRNSVWKLSEKQPGFNASDSNSDDLEDVAK